MHRPLIALALTLLAALPACQQERGPALTAGTWVLDREASGEATLPLWKRESSARMEGEMDSFVKPPSTPTEKHRRSSTHRLQQGFPAEISHELERVEVELSVFESRRFELKTEVPGFDCADSSGSWLLTETGNVHLVMRERDGATLDEAERLSCRLDDEGRLMIRWHDYLITVLSPPQ
ncbi:MAG: hypothetical protein DRQ55_17035 [Planctomycetota bacterium]|nr:MAG: hypothetical protein DRQ55_17035 [Planctomycetota bacterium]